MSFHLRTSFQAAPVVPVAAVAPHKTYYVPQNATGGHAPQQQQQQQQQQQITTNNVPPVPQTTTTTPRHSLHQRMPTNNTMGSLDVPLDALDFSERRPAIPSDISTLDCDSVKVDPHFNPAVEDTPFVPPLDVTIPVNLAHLAIQQQQHQQQSHILHNNNTGENRNALRRHSELTRQTSCQSRLEMSQASLQQQQQRPRSKSLLFVSHKMAIQLAMSNGGVLPPSYDTGDEAVAAAAAEEYDATLEDYANGAGAVTWDDGDQHSNSRLSYYTSPTDLYTSDDSEPIVSSQTTTKRGMVKRELKKIMFRFKHSTSRSKKAGKTLEPQHVVEGAVKDYDSFGSERGFC